MTVQISDRTSLVHALRKSRIQIVRLSRVVQCSSLAVASGLEFRQKGAEVVCANSHAEADGKRSAGIASAVETSLAISCLSAGSLGEREHSPARRSSFIIINSHYYLSSATAWEEACRRLAPTLEHRAHVRARGPVLRLRASGFWI